MNENINTLKIAEKESQPIFLDEGKGEIQEVELCVRKGFKILILKVKHIKSGQIIEISKIKIISNNKLTTKSLFLRLTNEGDILRNSAVGELLIFFNKKLVGELIGQEVDLIKEGEGGFLCIKAYK